MNFEINDRVRRIKEDPDRHGTVIEIDKNGVNTRCRVLWDAVPGYGEGCNYAKAKRTWIKASSLTKVI